MSLPGTDGDDAGSSWRCVVTVALRDVRRWRGRFLLLSLAAVLALGFLVAGCGSSTQDSAGGEASSTTTVAPGGTATTGASTYGTDDTSPDTTAGTTGTTNGDTAMSGTTTVLIKTSMGDITAELDADKAPLTVANFLSYVEDGSYDGTIFHRVIPGFMVQGGGFTPDMQQKSTRDPVKNEADNGLKNLRGTLAMARTGVVDSATSQFFINVADNAFLDFKSATPQGYGYAVFGKVTAGMDVVDAIVAVPTATSGGNENVPVTPVVIQSVKVVE
jgi:cyclophilin family peptidyl-prolyl cis-trans isomerase